MPYTLHNSTYATTAECQRFWCFHDLSAGRYVVSMYQYFIKINLLCDWQLFYGDCLFNHESVNSPSTALVDMHIRSFRN